MLFTFAMFLSCFKSLAGKGNKSGGGTGKYLGAAFSVSFFSSELITKGNADVSVLRKGGAGLFGGTFSSAFSVLLRSPGMGKRGGGKFFIKGKVVSVFLEKSKKTCFVVFFFLGLRAVAGKGVI